MTTGEIFFGDFDPSIPVVPHKAVAEVSRRRKL